MVFVVLEQVKCSVIEMPTRRTNSSRTAERPHKLCLDLLYGRVVDLPSRYRSSSNAVDVGLW